MDRANGAVGELLQQLKDRHCPTLKKAKRKIDDLGLQIEQDKSQLQKDTEVFTRWWKEQQGNKS